MSWLTASGVAAVLRTPAARELLRVVVVAPVAASLVALGAPEACVQGALKLFGL